MEKTTNEQRCYCNNFPIYLESNLRIVYDDLKCMSHLPIYSFMLIYSNASYYIRFLNREFCTACIWAVQIFSSATYYHSHSRFRRRSCVRFLRSSFGRAREHWWRHRPAGREVRQDTGPEDGGTVRGDHLTGTHLLRTPDAHRIRG